VRVWVSPLVVGIGLCALLACIPVNAKSGEEADTPELFIALVVPFKSDEVLQTVNARIGVTETTVSDVAR
jgi:hypothetical protein